MSPAHVIAVRARALDTVYLRGAVAHGVLPGLESPVPQMACSRAGLGGDSASGDDDGEATNPRGNLMPNAAARLTT